MTVIELITDEKWERALFTSYALSLSFFESRLLKEGIVRNGCRFIDVLADVDGYAMTLHERQSSRVGVDYRLVPVALNDGVFHPKIALLSGQAGDVLLVGSGNLTLYGYGRNLEVVEMLPLQRHPGITGDLSSFLTELAARKDILAAEIRCLDFWREKFSTDAIRAGPAPENRVVRIVHSVTHSVGDQIIDLAKTIGPVTEIRVLSPFYDPKADGILDFAERLACPKVVIGLLPGREEATTFPFGATRESIVKVAAALIAAPADERRLHAKWIEVLFKDGQRLVLSGSINATRKSLMTSDNVEVGVLRMEPAVTKSSLEWRACRLPTSYQLLKFRGAGVGIRLFVHADLNADGIIRGRILGANIVGGTWHGELAWPDGREQNIAATVGADGSFTANVARVKNVLISTGLQLALREPATARLAVGWVNQHAMLQAGRRGFLSPSTFLRFMSDTADASDDAALLRYIAASMTQLLDVFTAPSTARGEQPGHVESSRDEANATRAKKYGAEDLAPTDFTTHSLDQFGSDAEDDARAIRYLMRTLRHRLLERTEHDEEAREQSDASERDDEDESDETAIAADEATSAATDMLTFFDEQVRQLISRATSAATRGAIYSTWLEIVLPHLTKQAMAPDAPRRFAREWFTLVTSEQEKDQSPPSLIEYVTSAGLFLVASEKNADPIEPDQILRTITFVHERLARFFGSDLTLDVLRESAITPHQWPAIFTRKVLSWRRPITPEVSLQCVMAVPTFSQQVQIIKAALLAGTALPEGLPLTRTKAGRLLIDEATRRRRLPEVCRQAAESPICPHCHLRMSVSIQADLRQEHIAQCDNCSHFVARAR